MIDAEIRAAAAAIIERNALITSGFTGPPPLYHPSQYPNQALPKKKKKRKRYEPKTPGLHHDLKGDAWVVSVPVGDRLEHSRFSVKEYGKGAKELALLKCRKFGLHI